MFHTPAHKVAPALPQAGTVENRPYEGDPRVIVNQTEYAWKPAVMIYNGPDALVASHGSVFLVTPMSPDAKAWMEENLSHAQRFAGGFAVEARYIGDICAALDDAGLEVA